MSFDWGGFLGSIVGVFGAYGVAKWQLRNQNKLDKELNKELIIREKMFIFSDEVVKSIENFLDLLTNMLTMSLDNLNNTNNTYFEEYFENIVIDNGTMKYIGFQDDLKKLYELIDILKNNISSYIFFDEFEQKIWKNYLENIIKDYNLEIQINSLMEEIEIDNYCSEKIDKKIDYIYNYGRNYGLNLFHIFIEIKKYNSLNLIKNNELDIIKYRYQMENIIKKLLRVQK